LQDDIKKVGADTTRLSPLDRRTIILRVRELIDGALGRRPPAGPCDKRRARSPAAQQAS